ncbi:M56 family metallopeptidase [Cohnella endophytica]|nr:M56 family metallopeptidase [Cohnella endophytica]
MEMLFLKLLNMSITATYVILAVLLIRLLLKRAPKKYSYLLWVVVLFRLVCPVSFTSGLSLFNADPFDMTAAQRSGYVALNYVPADVGYMETPKVTVGIPTLNAVVNGSLPAPVPGASVNPLQIWILLGAVVWCLGFAAMLIYGMVTYIRLRLRMATAVRLDKHIFESDNIRSPFVLGFIKPRIYIPFGLGEQERLHILRHEACHLKRKDHLIKPIAFLVVAFHWFNPLVWLAFASMAKDMEMSCDEKVLSEIGTGEKKEYCASLLSFAVNHRFPAAGPLAFGETSVRERVKNVLRFKAPKRGVVALSAVACMIVVAACATNPTVNAMTKDIEKLYGNYSFDKQVYMNPLSSTFYLEGLKEYYTLTDKSLIITDQTGKQQIMATDYERTKVDEQEFRNSFFAEGIGVPDIAPYKERYQYALTDPSASPAYRLYVLDGEMWLAKVHKDTANVLKSEYIWSIYKIKKLDERIPGKAVIVEAQDRVDEFLALNKDFESGYDNDTSYNITPAACPCSPQPYPIGAAL